MTLLASLPADHDYTIVGTGHRPSVFAVTELANASVAAVGDELAKLMVSQGLNTNLAQIEVNQRLASLWFGYSFRPLGWEMPSLWDPIAGDYECSDGWIRLHTNLPHHRAAALRALNCAADRTKVAQAVKSWSGSELETEIVTQGGVAAQMRTREEWLSHPQGAAVSQEPLIDWRARRRVSLRSLDKATPLRPLKGLRVLDLTRVLAGPVSTRTLAGYGADVLRIDPPGWDEPGVIPDISLGKTMANLDLKTNVGREMFERLLSEADVLIHGYRPDALDALGYGRERRDNLAPNRIEVTLNAYGWTGPWAGRRGFDSLVQMSSGIAAAGQDWAAASKPTPLPVQALDHATGYLMAAAVLSALRVAHQTGLSHTAHLSLARTAELLASLSGSAPSAAIGETQPTDFSQEPETTSWGQGLRLISPLKVGPVDLRWSKGAAACGSTPAAAWQK